MKRKWTVGLFLETWGALVENAGEGVSCFLGRRISDPRLRLKTTKGGRRAWVPDGHPVGQTNSRRPEQKPTGIE
jgi:hypothetical protein